MTSIEKLLSGGGLVYIDCNRPGYQRKRLGKRFVYLNLRKKQIRNARTTARIESLVIPPQWSKVWICPDAKGHIQVTGIDQKSRKQYIYHAKWLALRGQDKFNQLATFGKGLAKLRKTIKRDLKLPALNLQKVCAIALRITTLRKKHMDIIGNQIAIRFIGKKGVPQYKEIDDKVLSELLDELRQTPGKCLFQYFDDFGTKVNLEPADLNSYLKESYGEDITCKTFRTWSACHAFLNHLCMADPAPTNAARNKLLQSALEQVATLLGNSKLISRKHYISPLLIDYYQDGRLDRWLKKTGDLPPKSREKAVSKKLISIFQKNR